MRVVINAQLDPATSGGIAQALLGLAYGLSQLDHPDVELIYVCSPESADSLRPYAGAGRIEVNRAPKLPPATGVRESNGFFESFGPDVVHFPYQSFTRVDVATLFNPHDLQHVHLPQFFAPTEVVRREKLFSEAFAATTTIVVGTNWVKEDIVRHYGVDPEKIVVTSFGSPLELAGEQRSDDVDRVLRGHNLKPGFALYPAQTWPHKNHLRLLEALHLAKKRLACRIPLVCTGHQTEHFAAIRRQAEELELVGQVYFLGRVPAGELAALYCAARFVIFPSLFEGGGFPVLEAFSAGLPVACSQATALPEVAGDAAVLFDPRDTKSIAQAAVRVYSDADLRRSLVESGRHRLTPFSWSKTAQVYLDLYRAGSRSAVLARKETKGPAHRQQVESVR